jgi:hypothetical protein
MRKKVSTVLLMLLGAEVLVMLVAIVVFNVATHGGQTCKNASVGCDTGPAVNFLWNSAFVAGGLFMFTLPAVIILWLWSLRSKPVR